MFRLHERPLLLILRFQPGALLTEQLRARRDVRRQAGRQGAAIGALRRDPSRGRVGQRLVERDQGLALQRVGVAARRPAVSAHGGGDDALLLGVGGQRALRTLEVASGLAICRSRKLRA